MFITICAAILTFIVVISSTSKSGLEKKEIKIEEAVESSKEVDVVIDGKKKNLDFNDDQKIITEYRISKETDDLETDYKIVNQLIKKYQGAIANSELNLIHLDDSFPSANLTIKIPTKQLESFLEEIGSIAKTTNSSSNQYDVSTKYFDNESRVKALEIEEKALLELLEKSEQIEDMLTIQKRLSTVRSEREDLIRGNKSFDNQIEFTTINLYIDEVVVTKSPKSNTFWEKIIFNWKNQQTSLKKIAEKILVLLFSYGIYLVVIICFVRMIVWKIKK